MMANKILGIIPARGGSKGIPRKNIRKVGGKPLIQWTIEAANACGTIDNTIISTDDVEIAEVAKSIGAKVPFLRAGYLATDEASSMDVILDVIEKLPGYDTVVLLQPTSPLRKAEDISNAIKMMQEKNAPACVSICLSSKHPDWMFSLETDNKVTKYMPGETATQRQLLSDVYFLNGAIYVANIKWLVENKGFISKQTVGYVMSAERSVDIDTELDLALVKFLNARLK